MSATPPRLLQRCVAEGLGTFGLVFAGCGAVVANELSGGAVTHVGVSATFGWIVAAMIVLFGPVSGAHLNPAVSLGFWMAGELEGRDVPAFVASQCLGALVASASLAFLYPAATQLGVTQPIGAVLPAFVMEVLLTMILMSVILACAVGHALPAFAAALMIGGTVGLCALFGGPLTGASMNPARSLGPALVSGQIGALWLYLTAPPLGAALAVWLYQFVWRGVRPD